MDGYLWTLNLKILKLLFAHVYSTFRIEKINALLPAWLGAPPTLLHWWQFLCTHKCTSSYNCSFFCCIGTLQMYLLICTQIKSTERPRNWRKIVICKQEKILRRARMISRHGMDISIHPVLSKCSRSLQNCKSLRTTFSSFLVQKAASVKGPHIKHLTELRIYLPLLMVHGHIFTQSWRRGNEPFRFIFLLDGPTSHHFADHFHSTK